MAEQPPLRLSEFPLAIMVPLPASKGQAAAAVAPSLGHRGTANAQQVLWGEMWGLHAVPS